MDGERQMVVRFPMSRQANEIVERVRRLAADDGCDVAVEFVAEPLAPVLVSPPATRTKDAKNRLQQKSDTTGGGGGGHRPTASGGGRRMRVTLPGVGSWTGTQLDLPCIVESHKLCRPAPVSVASCKSSRGGDGGLPGARVRDEEKSGDGEKENRGPTGGGDDDTRTTATKKLEAGGKFYKSCNISQILVLDDVAVPRRLTAAASPATTTPTAAAAPSPRLAPPSSVQRAKQKPKVTPVSGGSVGSGDSLGMAPDGLTPPTRGIRDGWYNLFKKPASADILAMLTLLEAIGSQNAVEEYKLGWIEEEVEAADDDVVDDESKDANRGDLSASASSGGGDGAYQEWEHEEEERAGTVSVSNHTSQTNTPHVTPDGDPASSPTFISPSRRPPPASLSSTASPNVAVLPVPRDASAVHATRPTTSPSALSSSSPPSPSAPSSSTSAPSSSTSAPPTPPPPVDISIASVPNTHDAEASRADTVKKLQADADRCRRNLVSTNKILRNRAAQELAAIAHRLQLLGASPS